MPDSQVQSNKPQSTIHTSKKILIFSVGIVLGTITISAIALFLLIHFSVIQHNDSSDRISESGDFEQNIPLQTVPTEEQDLVLFASSIPISDTQIFRKQTILENVTHIGVVVLNGGSYIIQDSIGTIENKNTGENVLILNYGVHLLINTELTIRKSSAIQSHNNDAINPLMSAFKDDINAAVLVSGANSYLSASNLTIETSSPGSHALVASDNSFVKMRDCVISTFAPSAIALSLGSNVQISIIHTKLMSNSDTSPLIYTNNIHSLILINDTGITTNNEILLVLDGNGDVQITNTSLSSTTSVQHLDNGNPQLELLQCGILILSSVTSIYRPSVSTFHATSSNFTIPASAEIPFIYLTNSNCSIVFSQCHCSFSPSQPILQAVTSQFGLAGTNGGNATFELYDSSVSSLVTFFDENSTIGSLWQRTMPGNQEQYHLANVEPLQRSILTDKQFVFLGSSVTLGMCSMSVSFPEYLAKRNGLISSKEAVSGTTLADRGEQSYVKRLIRNIPTTKQFDGFVFQLSTNDVHLKPAESSVGTISESFDGSEFNTSTTIGAIEYIIWYVKETWNCPIVFFTSPKLYVSAKYQHLISLLYDIQKKWKIHIIDLYHEEDMYVGVSEERLSLYMHDSIHPSMAGYLLWWTPVFEKYLIQFLTS